MLTKPTKSAVLREVFLRVLAPAAATLAALETTGGRRDSDGPAYAPRTLRVLLAEDNVVNQKVAQQMLAKLGHRVDTVSNGLEALLAVERATYDVVLMDLQMPQLDGLGAARRIGAELPPERRPPIVAVTASVLTEDRTACTAAGMHGFLSKPLRAHELSDVLGALAAGLPPVPAPQGEISVVLQQEPGGATARSEAIDRRLAELAGPDPADDRELFAQLLRSFLSRSGAMLAALQAAVEAGDPTEVEQRAHALKGAAANLGGEHLAALLAPRGGAGSGRRAGCRPLAGDLRARSLRRGSERSRGRHGAGYPRCPADEPGCPQCLVARNRVRVARVRPRSGRWTRLRRGRRRPRAPSAASSRVRGRRR